MAAARIRVKICGITLIEDGLAAVAYGADALGFILYPGSPRYISPANARDISEQLPPFVDRVGVLVDENIETAVQFVKRAGFSCLQLHGTEPVDYCRELKIKLPQLKIIKAFRVGDESRPGDFAPYEGCVEGFLLDTYVKGEKGGTGEPFDWSVLQGLNLKRPVILAGGLGPGNIAGAIAVADPYAVDINSGVEIEPGKKDHARLRDLMQQIRDITVL